MFCWRSRSVIVPLQILKITTPEHTRQRDHQSPQSVSTAVCSIAKKTNKKQRKCIAGWVTHSGCERWLLGICSKDRFWSHINMQCYVLALCYTVYTFTGTCLCYTVSWLISFSTLACYEWKVFILIHNTELCPEMEITAIKIRGDKRKLANKSACVPSCLKTFTSPQGSTKTSPVNWSCWSVSSLQRGGACVVRSLSLFVDTQRNIWQYNTKPPPISYQYWCCLTPPHKGEQEGNNNTHTATVTPSPLFTALSPCFSFHFQIRSFHPYRAAAGGLSVWGGRKFPVKH